MPHIKIYGIKERLNPIRKELSDSIHKCVVQALKFPEGKRAHRFFAMDREDIYYPDGRSEAYTVIEIAMMEGRTALTKKKLIALLIETIEKEVGISKDDIEITIIESAPSNWGFRGHSGDEVRLSYRLDV